MPKIIINEIDDTRVELEALATDVVYVPGLSVNYDASDASMKYPILCTTLEQFQSIFGDGPSTILEASDSGLDKGYVYASELIDAGLPVYYHALGVHAATTATVTTMAQFIANKINTTNTIDILSDKNTYQIKYFTSGGYATWAASLTASQENLLPKVLIDLASSRGDAIALIDPVGEIVNFDKNYKTNFNQVFTTFQTRIAAYDDSDGNKLSYAASFIPCNTYTCSTIGGKQIQLGGSFAYLKCLARSIKSNPNYLAIAGVSRGLVPNLAKFEDTAVSTIMTASVAESFQPDNAIAVNPIVDIKPYGYTIWGNRTLFDNSKTASGGADGLVARSFLNLRNLMCDVKKRLYTAAKALMFEQNNDILWVNYKAMVTPLLDNMVQGGGIKNYKLVKLDTKKRGKLEAKVILQPIYALENVEVTVVLTDSDVTVE